MFSHSCFSHSTAVVFFFGGSSRGSISGNVMSTLSDEDSQSVACPDRFSQKEPNMFALRFYLASSPKAHQPGLTKSQRVLIAKQAKNFASQIGKLMYKRNGKLLTYVESVQRRQDIIQDIHK